MAVFISDKEQIKAWALLEADENKRLLIFGRNAETFVSELVENYCEYEKGRYRLIQFAFTEKTSASPDAVIDHVQKLYHPGKTQDVLLLLNVQFCKGIEMLIEKLQDQFALYMVIHSAIEPAPSALPGFTRVCCLPVDYNSHINNPLKKKRITVKRLLSDAYLQGKAESFDASQRVQKRRKVVAETLNRIACAHKVQELELLQAMTLYLLANGHEPITARGLAAALQERFPSLNHKIVARYLEYLCEYQLFYPVRRYDTERECVLTSGVCYYAADPLFIGACIGRNARPFIAAYKNLLALELLHHAEEFYVGTARANAVDFMVVLPERRYYIRVLDDLNNEKAVKAAVNGLLRMRNLDEKIIIGDSDMPEQIIQGIRCLNYDRGIAYVSEAAATKIKLNMKRL